ncbi:MAG: hypothetical protein AB7O49_07655 [Sphingomonadales bacterium]
MRSLKMHHPDTANVADAVEALTILAADAFIALVFIGGILLGLAI